MITLLVLLYMQGVVASVSFACFVLAVFYAVIGVIFIVENKGELTTKSKYLLKWAAVFLSVSVFTPSKDTLSIAIGLYATSEVIEVVSQSALAKKALEAINVELDSLVKRDAK